MEDDGNVNYEMLIDELNTWQADERLFRDYFRVQEGELSFESFLKIYESNPEDIRYVLHQEDAPSTLLENDFIHSGRDVVISKSPRYSPVFFHDHSFFELIYILSGQGVQHFRKEKFELQAGDLCILATNVVHGIEVNSDSIVLNILIRQSTFMDIFMNTIRDKTQVSQFFFNNLYTRNKIDYMLFHTGDDPVIRNDILDMYSEQIMPDEYSNRIICSLMTIFFTQLMRRHRKDLVLPEMRHQKGDYEAEILNYMINGFADASLEDLAGRLHFSRQHCSRMIKEIFGCTFSELLTRIRIQEGRNLLISTPLSVALVSEKTGYKNPETFIRAFKKHEGCTPAEFRKKEGAPGS